MLKRLKKSTLIKNTFIYTVVQLFNKSLPFLLLPILTRYLSVDDYGIIATYNTFIGIVSIFIGLGLSQAVGVNYFQLQKDELQHYVGNIFNIMLISTFLVTLIVLLFHELILQKIHIPILLLYVAIIVSLAQNITGINLVLWRSQERTKPFVLYELSQTFFNIMVTLILVVLMKYSWEGRIVATASASVIFGLLSIFIIFKRRDAILNYSKELITDALRFGIPLVPHHLSVWMRTGVDILLIASIVGLKDTGIYSVGYQLGAAIGIVIHAFNNAYSPYLFKKLRDITEGNKVKLVKFSYLFFLFIILFAIGLSKIFVFILPYFLDKSFQESSQYIIWIALSFAFNGMYMIVVNYIYYAKKTHLISIITVPTSVFHVVLSYSLIKLLGPIGAAYASLISSFLTFICIWYISNKVYYMPWLNWKIS